MSNLLSQGGYGCVYYPGLNCENEKSKPDKKYVTKLQKKNFNSENEHKISMMVKKIKHYEYFFLPIESQCPINLISYKAPGILSLKHKISIYDAQKMIYGPIYMWQFAFQNPASDKLST